MNRNTEEELFPVVDTEGNTISTALRSVCHNGESRLLHPVVHLHLFNERNELFLQKRSMKKDLLPGKWDTSVGGHFTPGETASEALARETSEELGINDLSQRFIKKYIWESPRERELVYTFIGTAKQQPVINNDEIDEGRFWPLTEIFGNLGNGIFTPNFEHEFKMLNIISGPDKI